MQGVTVSSGPPILRENGMAYEESRLIDLLVAQIRPEAEAVLVRVPVIDPRTPDTSDVDVAAFTDIEDLRPARLHVRAGADTPATMVDITWLPSAWLADSEALAVRGLIPHRVLTSELVWSRSPDVAERCRRVAALFYQPDIHRRRLSGFFEMGGLTVREIGITWNFPALALFWLHMAFAATLSAGVDGSRRLCPNLYTRPFDYLRELARTAGQDLVAMWTSALRVEADFAELTAAVRRIHAVIVSRFSEPSWPDAMRMGTRVEYRYWVHPGELEWRVSAASEMFRRGDAAAAIHYLRFYAYALARAPMVYARALEGRNVSYLRPERAVRPDLERLCPDILDDIDLALSGSLSPDRTLVEQALATLHVFKARIVETLHASGAPVPELEPWIPHRSPPA